ncbi:DgyrCDS10922 [Dimorphilus gyrociliatus]|uniref:DgyrCDS10922 n=1 Tax=Dimorphilus gyrociliatus TaxID=2664684 RepID=A0A7I8W4B2_9ANNE|nr:DgyrCDS10922 [Dimorphilus gyrociliatus]
MNNFERPEENEKEGVSYMSSTLQTDTSLASLYSIDALNLSISSGTIKAENRSLKSHVRDLQEEIANLHQKVTTWRKKCNDLERERVDTFSKNNEELGDALNDVAKIRAQLEKSEATRQSSEYEMTKLMRDLNNEKRANVDKEKVLTELNENMQKRMTDMSTEIEKLYGDLNNSKGEARKEAERHMKALKDQEARLSDLVSTNSKLERERDKLKVEFEDRDSQVKILSERLKGIQIEKKQQADVIRDNFEELNHIREKEQNMIVQYDISQERVKHLEDQLESERAAHLESKFNAEVLQLKIKDLTGSMEVERTSKIESIETTDKLNKQLLNIQSQFEEEKQTSHDIRHKYNQLQADFKTLKKQLKEEHGEKKSVMTKLCGQLELHQTHIDQLKKELNEAKQTQTDLKRNYESNIAEIEGLLNGYQLQDSQRRKVLKNSVTYSGSNCVNGVRKVLQEYKKKVKELSEESSAAKENISKEKREKEHFKQLYHAKERSLENTKQAQVAASKELKKCKTDYTDKETFLAKLRTDLKSAKNGLSKEREQRESLLSEFKKLQEKLKNDEESRTNYIHCVYHQLKNGKFVGKQPNGSLTWSQVVVLLNEQVAVVIQTLSEADEKLRELQEIVERQSRAIKEIDENRIKEIESLKNVNDERSKLWEEQKNALETHYKQVLKQVETQQKQTKALADQALNRVKSSGNVRASLQEENEQLRSSVQAFAQQQNSLQLAVTMLSGALMPLHNRTVNLINQRRLILKENKALTNFKTDVQALISALNFEQDHPKLKSKCTTSPLLKFRSIVICVIASNRLNTLLAQRSTFIVVDDAVSGLKRVCVQQTNNNEQSNFKNQALISDVASSMVDLQIVLSQKQLEDRKLIENSSRNSFMKMLTSLSNYYNHVDNDFSKDSLISQLGKGLANAQRRTTYRDSTIQAVQVGLQQQLLNFTKKLHASELHRRDLHSELLQLKADSEDNERKDADLSQLKSEVNDLIQQAGNMVSKQQLESVCDELASALKREEKAQKLLKEQTSQLEELRRQAIKDASIAQENNFLKTKLKKQTDRGDNLERQTRKFDKDHIRLQQKIDDAEKSLRTASKDKQILKAYMKNVEIALDKIMQQGMYDTTTVDLTPLLSADLVPSVPKPGADLAQCQLLVATFVDAYQRINQRIYQSHEELLNCQEEVTRLKKNISQMKRPSLDQIRKPEYHFQPLIIDEGSPIIAGSLGPDGE